MTKMTITEGLAEIKLIEKKVDKKKDVVLQNLTRFEVNKDPFESEGGSRVVMAREIQAIKDLQDRLVKIRGAIAKANIDTTVALGEQTKTIYDWLTWKREVSEKQAKFATDIHTKLKQTMDQAAQRPQVYTDPKDNAPKVATLVANVDYGEFVTKSQKLSDLIESLDGKLSLINATTTIEI